MKAYQETISPIDLINAPALEQVFAEVVLGRPSADCRHLGICKIERLYSNDFFSAMINSICSSSDKVYALATLQKGSFVELAFQRAFMDAGSFEQHFKQGVFIMEEDFILTENFFSKSVKLKAGNYKVRFSDRLLSVRFNL